MIKYRQTTRYINFLSRQRAQQLRFTSTNVQNSPSENKALPTEWQNAKPFEEIPSMGDKSMMKDMLPWGKYGRMELPKLLVTLKQDMGPIVRAPAFMGRPTSVITHNPNDFEIVFRNEGIWPIRPGGDAQTYHRTVHRKDFFEGVTGLVAVHGEKWGSFRSAVNPVLLQPKNVRVYLHKMAQVNDEFIKRIRQIRDPETLEVPATFQEEMNRWTLESVSVVALDKQLGLITTNRDNPDLKKMISLLNDFFELGLKLQVGIPIWKYFKTPKFWKFMKVLDGLLEIGNKYVNEAIERLDAEKKMDLPEKPENEKSVLEKLIKIDRKIATVMAIDLILAGVDTTSTTFTALLLCLAKHPEKQEKLREEIRQILPHKDSQFEPNSLNNIPYTRACIKEALRMYPLTVGNTRILANDAVLSGYQVPKGTQVTMVSTALLQEDEHYTKAKEYLPERWLRPNKAAEEAGECPHALKASSPFIYLPFGFGPRSCAGRRIVEMELELGIARLVRNFHIEYNYPTDNAFKFKLINIPNIPLTFKFTDVEN
ncbi:cytochrome P450 CYP12A2-like [Musca vetustissima]|uniref:cytochrome P450 CYP12A2-like n=1 Tax=Musca vetustissima TaxID=27455 RepID=UPI002AB65F0E|nr:cytochrome P450 CYP12A2-like [Musca vetustissima]